MHPTMQRLDAWSKIDSSTDHRSASASRGKLAGGSQRLRSFEPARLSWELPGTAYLTLQDFLYAAAPSLRSSQRQQSASAPVGPQHNLRLFDEQDKLAKALLQKKPIYRAAMQAHNGSQADFTSPDRGHHAIAPAAPDALPHWSEQKLLHRLAKESVQGKPVLSGPASIRQKLFGNTVQRFAIAEQQLQAAYPASLVSPATCVPGKVSHPQPAVQMHSSGAVMGSKRKDCMDHFVSKKPRHSSSSNKMPSKTAFDAAEKLMHGMCTCEE